MKRIVIIATGGTISAHHEDRTDFRNYRSGHYSGEDFVTQLPELADYAEVEVVQLSNFSSTRMEDSHWSILHQTVMHHLAEEDCDGVVITHGTNTLEESAYLLHLTLKSEKPVIITGAQRPFSALGSDAQINLLDAVRVAADDSARGMGVLVVLNNVIASAREVTKGETYKLHSFQLHAGGQIGSVDADRSVQLYYQPLRRYGVDSALATFQLPKTLPMVDIIYSYAGATGEMIDALIAKGVQGIVIAGTGAGRITPKEEEALRRAKEAGIYIVMSSRVGAGRVVPIECYDDLPMITADNLSPQKARILLKLGLNAGLSFAELQNLFDTH
ncbi:L-asparaginase 2 [Ignatzschineria cameli]|nr:L-asparaginase 2 [Ignatzschineria cameli]